MRVRLNLILSFYGIFLHTNLYAGRQRAVQSVSPQVVRSRSGKVSNLSMLCSHADGLPLTVLASSVSNIK
jgi:hypothetical protein